MPIPKPKPNEDNQKFVARCMGNETMKKDYPDNKQRVAICLGQTRKKGQGGIFGQVLDILGLSLQYDECEECGSVEELSSANLVIPQEYEDAGEISEDYSVEYLFEHSKSSEYQGRRVTLNKPFRTPDGPKKFAVYVKNGSGKVVIVRFGDPNMKIKKNIPERRKSFRARHKCDQQKDKTTPAYWSCKMW
jgi:GrpB-like predicted nucleotidyltransferase (UPF0157 family)